MSGLTTLYAVMTTDAGTLVKQSDGSLTANTLTNWPLASIPLSDTGHASVYYGTTPSGLAGTVTGSYTVFNNASPDISDPPVSGSARFGASGGGGGNVQIIVNESGVTVSP